MQIFTAAILWTARNVALGSASKAFRPFMTSKDLKGSLEEIKNKLMVNFDPLQCFLKDLQVTTLNALILDRASRDFFPHVVI